MSPSTQRFLVLALGTSVLAGFSVLLWAKPFSGSEGGGSHSEELVAWQCSGVTDQNWWDPVWVDQGHKWTSMNVCEGFMNDDPENRPCTLANMPMFCHEHTDGGITIQNHSRMTVILLDPRQRAHVGDALVIIEPTAPDPRGE